MQYKIKKWLIKRGVQELDMLQKQTLDNIGKCYFNTGILNSEFAKARKIIHHKNLEQIFDEMLKKYWGVKRKELVRSATTVSGKDVVMGMVV